MKKSLSILAAGVLAMAGAVQAQTFDSPTQAGEASTMTNGQPNQLTTNSPYSDRSSSTVIVDTTVLGAGPLLIVGPLEPVGVPPNPILLDEKTRRQAAATFNSPARAGEMSTMTGGAPNMVTDNYAMPTFSY
jgi:hypothetical protein